MLISTLLGSCVAACLFDPVNGVVGLNHFLLANRKYRKRDPVIATDAGRYGLHAMEMLINEMVKRGALRHQLQAKAFGGANVLTSASAKDSFFCVGEVNIRFIREFLRQERIPLVASDLGGASGRVIHFDSGDYSIYLRRMRNSHNQRLVQDEHNYWEHSIEEHEHDEAKVDFW